MNIRRGTPNDLEKILEVSNNTFIPERDESFDFRYIMPRVYSNTNYCKDHFLLFDDGDVRAVCGNISDNIETFSNKFPFTILGTVSTLPEYQGKGYMKALMKEVEKDNINRNVIFSCLTGIRERYNYYGYEQIGYRYSVIVIDYFFKHNKKEKDIKVDIANESDLKTLADIFNKKSFIKRNYEEFILRLKCSESKIYSIKYNDELVGYFSYSKRKHSLKELDIFDLSLTKDILLEIHNVINEENLKINVSPFAKELLFALGKYAEEVVTSSPIRVKVYNYPKFLEMALLINKDYLPLNAKEIYTIDGMNYLIEIKNGSINITIVNEKGREFSSMDFIYYAFNNISLNDSKIFPLMFDISDPDLF